MAGVRFFKLGQGQPQRAVGALRCDPVMIGGFWQGKAPRVAAGFEFDQNARFFGIFPGALAYYPAVRGGDGGIPYLRLFALSQGASFS